MAFHFKAIASAAAIGMAVTACTDTTTAGGNVTSGLNRNVVIVNATGETIWRFYGSRVTTNSWEEDILGSSVLSAGNSINIDFDDGTGSCLFDMKAEFQDGRSIVRNDVNVCTAVSVTFR